MTATAGMTGRQQLIAILALIIAVVLVALMPVWVAGALGKVLQDALVSMSDKAVVGLIGVLGTVTGLSFRTSPADAARVDNTSKAFDAIAAAQAAPAQVQTPSVTLDPGQSATVAAAPATSSTDGV